MGERIALLVTRHRALTILLTLTLTLGASWGLTQVTFSTAYRVFFPASDPGLVALNRVEDVFTKTDNILVVVHDPAADVFAGRGLEAVQEATAAGWQLPFASRVDSLTNFPHFESTEDDIVQRELVNVPAAELSDADRDNVRKVALADPILHGSLVSDDGHTAAVNINLLLPGESPTEVNASADAARELKDRLHARYPELTFHLTGMALMNHAFMEASVNDMGVIMPVVALVIFGLVALWLRSVLATLVIGLVTLAASAVTMSVAGWLGYPITPPSAAAPIVALTLAVADGVHIVRTCTQLMAQGRSRRAALIESMRINFKPVTYTSLTTMVGFACLNFAETPPVWHLANMTVAGVFIAWLLSITLLPALIDMLPIRGRQSQRRSVFFEKFGLWITCHRNKVLVASAAIVALSAVGASRLETNDEFVAYFDPAVDFRQATDFAGEHLSGIYRLELEVGSGGDNAIAEPAYLERLDAYVSWLREQPEVHHVYAVTDILKRVNQTVMDGDPTAYQLPDNREAAAQYLLLYEMGLPPGLGLNDRINVDKSSSRVTVTIDDLPSREVRALAARMEGWLEHNAPEPMWADVTGPVVIFSALSERNTRTMMGGNLASLLLISLCLVGVLRSIRLAGVSLLPNILPVLVGYGLWGIVMTRLNIVASVAGTVSLGIIVDDTIHFLMKYELFRRERSLSAKDAVVETLVEVGPAMAITTVVLAAGFLSLALSSFQMTSHLGILTGGVAIAALATDLLLLPSLLLTFAKDDAAQPSTHEPLAATPRVETANPSPLDAPQLQRSST